MVLVWRRSWAKIRAPFARQKDINSILSTNKELNSWPPQDFITYLFCPVDDKLDKANKNHKHNQAKLYPSEVVYPWLAVCPQGRGESSFLSMDFPKPPPPVPKLTWANSTVPIVQQPSTSDWCFHGISGESTQQNKELVAQEIANGAISLFGGVPGAQATIRSVLMLKENATLRIAGISVGLFVLIELLAFQNLLQYIPSAVFIGILIKVGFDVFDFEPIKLYFITVGC